MDGILLTHCDNDHYSRKTCRELAPVTKEFHAPHYVAGLLEDELGIKGNGHDIGAQFVLGNTTVTLAAAYPDTPLILWHWGSVDAPEWKEFNGNPEELRKRIINPRRVVALNPGEPYKLARSQFAGNQ